MHSSSVCLIVSEMCVITVIVMCYECTCIHIRMYMHVEVYVVNCIHNMDYIYMHEVVRNCLSYIDIQLHSGLLIL